MQDAAPHRVVLTQKHKRHGKACQGNNESFQILEDGRLPRRDDGKLQMASLTTFGLNYAILALLALLTGGPRPPGGLRLGWRRQRRLRVDLKGFISRWADTGQKLETPRMLGVEIHPGPLSDATAMGKKKYTMQDVARVAGVSIGTASAVINGSGSVSPARKQRVQDAIEMLDYHPDQVARSLRKGRTHVIGMVVPDLTHEFYPEVIRGAQDAASEYGFSVILCDSKDAYEQEREQVRMLRGRRVDGMLLACSESSSSRTQNPRAPTVYFDRVPQGEHCTGVTTDGFGGASEATRYLIGLGHERIALMVGPNRLVPHHRRLEGFRVAMQRSGLPVRDEYLRSGDLSVECGTVIARALLALPRPPTAVIVDNNRMLRGLLGAMHEAHVRCPAELSIIAFDDYPWLAYLRPSITAVAQPTYELGRQAALTLIQRIENPDAPHTEGIVELQCELRIRDSVGPPSREGFRQP